MGRPRTKPTPSHVPDFKAVASELRRVVPEATFEAVKTYGDAERLRFIDKIEKQAFQSFQEIFYPESGTNLSPGWLARKERKARDLRTMIATGWYIKNIKLFTRKARLKGEPTLVKIGIHPNTLARDLDGKTTDVPLWLVATYNEHGSLDGKLPARPHWGPHLDTMHSNAPRTRRAVLKAVKKTLRANRFLKHKIVVT